MLKQTRTAQVFKNKAWHVTPFESLKSNDIFRLFEDDGEPVLNADNSVFCVAESDAFEFEGTYGIKCAPLSEIKEND